jgi:nucleoside-diphosphate-sugar epimerase
MGGLNPVLVVGASGVIGAATVEKFAKEGWDVIAISRRRPVLPAGIKFEHVSVDLTDGAACAAAISAMKPISHLVYCAVAEAPGLFSGWTDPEMIALNKRMFANLAEPLAACGNLAWVGLLQGTKAYGAHLHPMEMPAREDRPRDPHANFYWEQEDIVRALAAQHGFGWTIFRPQIVFGGAPGAVMNPVIALGAYAAICKARGLPLAYPSTHGFMWELTDAALLADAHHWAATRPVAAGQIYNVTNGDVFVLRDAWPHVAAAYRMETGEPRVLSLAKFFAEAESIAAWDELVARHGLVAHSLDALVNQSHHYVDMLLDRRIIEAGGLPQMVSAIKIRKAGFTECCDSLDSLLFWLRRMVETKLLPPDLA